MTEVAKDRVFDEDLGPQSAQSSAELDDWACQAFVNMGKKYVRTDPVKAVQMTVPFKIKSPGGIVHKGEKGDYLVSDGDGGFYAMPAVMFEESFRPFRERKAKK